MVAEKKERKNFGSGMEIVKSGVDTSKIYGGRRCICSPGGWSYGNLLGGCACGCFWEAPATENGDANNSIVN